MEKVEIRKAKVKPGSVNISFEDVAAVADRMVWTGRLPTVSGVCKELNVRSIDKVGQYLALWKAGYSHTRADKMHIVDLSSNLQHLLAEDFERQVIALTAKFRAECAEIRGDRDRLTEVNQQQAAQIEALTAALGDAEVKIAEQAGRIARLKNEIAVGRDALAKAEHRIRDARQELTIVEHRLDDPFPESGGGV
ncbi:MAG: DNA-binding protein [Syntrophobacteraceae bacterium]|jgi:multidrug resistance efflux pump